MNVQLKRLREGAVMPTYGSEGAACFDLYSAEQVEVPPGKTVKVPLGFAMAIPEGWYMEIRPRSGLSLKTGIRLPNSPATIDSDYRGEVSLLIWNTSDKTITVDKGMRLAQGILHRTEKTYFVFVEQLSPTTRGDGGFGSTGV